MTDRDTKRPIFWWDYNPTPSKTNHDAVPEARAAEPESPVPLRSGAAPANTQEPVAWAIQFEGEDIDVRSVFSDRGSACRHVANYAGKNQIVPLYRSPTLTDEEREAIEWYANFPDGIHAATLRKLLERLTGNGQGGV
jgi:hypothetical protein